MLRRIKELFDVSYDELLEPQATINAMKKGGSTMIQHMTNSEEQVMRLLWQSDRPLSCAEIVALSENKTWKDSYVHSLIKSLIKKDIVKIAAFELVSRSYARKFAPKISYDEYVLLSGYSERELNDRNKMLGFFKTFISIAGSNALKNDIKTLIE